MPNKDKLAVGRHSRKGILKSLREKLKKYANDPRIKGREAEYVREQLRMRNEDTMWYKGIENDIKNGTVRTMEDIKRNPGWIERAKDPVFAEQLNEERKRSGEDYVQKNPTLRPDQEQYSKNMIKQAEEISGRIFPKIGQPTQLETPVNDMMMKMLEQYQQQHMGRNYLAGGLENTFPGLRENLSSLGQGAKQAGQSAYGTGQQAYNAINPYLQNAAAQGGQLARSGANQAQSYLSAAQPYAQKAVDLGGDIFNAIRAPAVSAAGQIQQGGIGSLLNILRGRV